MRNSDGPAARPARPHFGTQVGSVVPCTTKRSCPNQVTISFQGGLAIEQCRMACGGHGKLKLYYAGFFKKNFEGRSIYSRCSKHH